MIIKLLRITSILCGICYSSMAWIWAYAMSLFVSPLGMLGLLLWYLANKVEFGSSGFKKSKLERIALYSNLFGFAVSVLSFLGWMIIGR